MNYSMWQEIEELLNAEIAVSVDGDRLRPGAGYGLIRDGADYMKDFFQNENGELVRVDYYSYKRNINK